MLCISYCINNGRHLTICIIGTYICISLTYIPTITPLLCMTLVACFTFFRPLLHNHIVTACCLQCVGGLLV